MIMHSCNSQYSRQCTFNDKELLEGVCFLVMYEKILSSPTFECGMVRTSSATLKSISNINSFVPSTLYPLKSPRYGRENTARTNGQQGPRKEHQAFRGGGRGSGGTVYQDPAGVLENECSINSSTS